MMDKEEYCCVCKPKKKAKKCCVDLVIFIVSILLAFTVGLLIGIIPILGTILLLASPAIIVLAIVFLVWIIIRAIELKCDKKCKEQKEDDCY